MKNRLIWLLWGSALAGVPTMSLHGAIPDGHTDIVWRHATTGANAIWFMNQNQLVGGVLIQSCDDLSWRLGGAGDFNRDGNPDLVWSKVTENAYAVWWMDGPNYRGSDALPSAAEAGWDMLGSGDFNQDGQPDVVLRHRTTGQNALWIMDRTTIVSGHLLPQVEDLAWHLAGTGDFNGDRKCDLVWRNYDNGTNAVWFMDGVNYTTAGFLPGVPEVNWEITSTGDFNQDGQLDLLWRHQNGGGNVIWFLHGLTKIGSTYIDDVAEHNPNWKIVATGDFGAYQVPVANIAPTLSTPPDLMLTLNESSANIPFTVADEDTDVNALVVTSATSNPDLISPQGIAVSGTGAHRFVRITPVMNQTGTTTITLTVCDGLAWVSASFTVTVFEQTELEIPKATLKADCSSTGWGWLPPYAIDGSTNDPGWHNGYQGEVGAWLRLQLSQSYPLCRLDYYPRKWLFNGTFRQYRIYVTDSSSTREMDWGDPVAAGLWTWDPGRLYQSVTFTPKSGRYLILQCIEGLNQYASANEVTLYHDNRLPNQPPKVTAGPDRKVMLSETTLLNGAATDDGQPPGHSLTYLWELVQGPAPVVFSQSTRTNTSVTFSAAGNYTLRLTAFDGLLSASDDLILTVIDDRTQDSDHDGLPDYLERTMTGYRLNHPDSDGDGILDGDEDYDGDLLSNYAELTKYGSNPCNAYSLSLARYLDVAAPTLTQTLEGMVLPMDGEFKFTARLGTDQYEVLLSVVGGGNNTIRLSLSRAKAGAAYDLYVSQGLLSSPQKQLWFRGEPGQTLFEVPIPPWNEGRFWAASAEDTDGDGLSDGTEVFITKSQVDLADSDGNGVDDGFEDSDGDQWHDLMEWERGTDPKVFDPPPAPQLVTAVKTPGISLYLPATLTWQPCRGPVVRYCMEKWDPMSENWTPLAEVSGETYAFTDAGASGGDEYRVRAEYAMGPSAWSATARAQEGIPTLRSSFHLAQGQGGRRFLVAGALPANIAKVRVLDFNGTMVLELPISRFVKGSCELNSSEAIRVGTSPWLQAVDPAGQGGPLVPCPLLCEETHEWMDGRDHLTQNACFLLQAATVNKTFNYQSFDGGSIAYERLDQPSDVVTVGFHAHYRPGWIPSEFLRPLPYEENYLFRNFVFNPQDFSAGAFVTGASVQNDIRILEAPKYRYNASTPSPVPTQLPEQDRRWIYAFQPNAQFDDIGVVVQRDGSEILNPQARNVHGLRIKSVKLSRANLSPIQFPVIDATHSALGINRAYFVEVETPVLTPDGYFFESPTPPKLYGTRAHVFPYMKEFVPTQQTPLLIVPWGTAYEVYGWAKYRIANGDPNKSVFIEQYFDRAYKADGNGNPTTETGHLCEYGDFIPTEPGLTILTTKPAKSDGTGPQGRCPVHVIKLQLDVNHDGLMDLSYEGPDNTSPDRSFLFWINDDHDAPGGDTGTGEDRNTHGQTDLADERIACPRDLEDLARLWIVGLPDLPAAQGYRATLSWREAASLNGGPAIRIFQAAEMDGGDQYLKDVNAAQLQLSSMYVQDVKVLDHAESLGTIRPGTEYELPRDAAGHPKYCHLLFEGVASGSGELVLTVTQDGQIIAQTSAFLELRPIEYFYSRVVVENANHIPTISDDFTSRGPSVWRNTGVTCLTPTDETAQHIVFVHGWNMNHWEYENFSETLYKRLYWQGYRGSFSTVRWPTFSSDDFRVLAETRAFLTYNNSEYRAFRSGRAVADYLQKVREQLPNHTIGVCAHSMGNVVVTEALKILAERGQAPINNYVMMQAATPAHMYNPDLPNDSRLGDPNLFPAADAYRGYATDINRAVKRRIFNFYNPEDFALATGTVGLGDINREANWEYNQMSHRPVAFHNYQRAPNALPFDWYLLENNVPIRESGDFIRTGDGIDVLTKKTTHKRALKDTREIMTYASRSRSKAAGALTGVGGIIADEVDLSLTEAKGGRVHFTGRRYEHSGQFNFALFRVSDFYKLLLQNILGQN